MRVRDIRRQVLEEWRGLPEPEEKDRCLPVKTALRALLDRLGLSEFLDEEAIRTAWREIVGDFLADHSSPESIRKGVLIIQVLQPTVRYELERSWKREILKKLQNRFGGATIREVRFR